MSLSPRRIEKGAGAVLLGEAESSTAPAFYGPHTGNRCVLAARSLASVTRRARSVTTAAYHPPSVSRRPLFEVTRELTAVAMGRRPADLVIRGGRLVNVHTREILDGVDVAVAEGRVAMFGDASHTVGSGTEQIDADGAYLVPGLIDTHLHVESVMVTVTRFAEAVLPHGTTAAFIDNHEMANVFGLEGMGWMLEEGRGLPLKVYLAVPSCVPALPGFEDAGAAFGPDEIREALGWGRRRRSRRDDEHARRDRRRRGHPRRDRSDPRGGQARDRPLEPRRRARPPAAGLHRRRRRLLPRDDEPGGRAREAPRGNVGPVPRRVDVP